MPKTIAAADGSFLAYAAASAGEKRSFVYTERSTGKAKEFSGKTKFKNWLAEYNDKLESEFTPTDDNPEFEPLTTQDFDFEEVQITPEDFQYSTNILNRCNGVQNNEGGWEVEPLLDKPISAEELAGYRLKIIDWWEDKVVPSLPANVADSVKRLPEGSISKHTVLCMLRDWQQRAFAHEMIIYLDHGDTFRHTGVTMQKYKDRAGVKPLNLQIVKDWLQTESHKHGYTCEVVTGIEADDMLAIHQTKGWVLMNKAAKEQGYKNFFAVPDNKKDDIANSVDKYVSCTVDKDNAQVSGFWLNTYKDTMGNAVMDEPKLVYGVGGLYKKQGKSGGVGGYGFKFLMLQVVLGDTTDTFSGTKLSNTIRKSKGEKPVRIGEVSIFNRLSPCKTYKDCLQVVVDIYKELYPWESFTYKHWRTGKEITATWKNIAQEVFMCAYMLRTEKDNTSLESLCNEYGVDYA